MQFREWFELGAGCVQGSILEREGVMEVWYCGEVPRVAGCGEMLEARGVVAEIGDDDLQNILREVHRPNNFVLRCESSQVATREFGRARPRLVGLEQHRVRESSETRYNQSTSQRLRSHHTQGLDLLEDAYGCWEVARSWLLGACPWWWDVEER